MAQIGSVNATFTASVGGLTAGVDAAGKAFKALGGDTSALRSSLSSLSNLSKQGFLEVGPAAGAARTAFEGISASINALVENFRSGSTSAEQFLARMSALTAEAKQMAQATAAAAAITRENTTAEQEYFAAIDRITNAVRNGGLAEDVAARAREAAYQTYLRATEAIDRQAAATVQLGDALSGLDAGGLAGQFSGIADAFAADSSAALGLADATGAAAEALRQTAAAAEVAAIAEEQRQAMLERAAAIEKGVMTAAQQHAAAIAELDTLYGAGALSAEAYAAAVAQQDAILAEADGSAAAMAASIDALSETHARGAAIARANMTAEEQYASKVAELNSLLAAGAISQETFNRAEAAAAAAMRNAGNAADSMSSSLGGIATRLNVLIGIDIARLFASIASTVANTVSSFISMGQAEAGVIDQTSKMAARLGVTYGEMAGLSLAAEKAGVSLDTMKSAMTKADVAFVAAAQGSAQASAAFDRIGLSAEQLNGMGTADRFQLIAKSIAALPTEAERAAAAVQIFGRSGADLLPLFEGGAEGIAKAREEAERLGLSLTNAQGQDVQKLVSSFEMAQQAISGVVQQVVAYLSPAITGVVEQFNTFIGDIGGANIGQAIGEGILAGAEYLAGIADWVIANFSGTFAYLSKVWEQAGGVVDVLGRVASFLSGVWNTAKVILGSIVIGFTGAFQGLATIAQKIGQFLGFDTATLDVVVAGAKAFNEELSRGIQESADNAARDFGNAFATDAKPLGEAIAGPVTTALRDARANARESANQIDEAKKAPVEIKQKVEVNLAQALKAVDSRSTAGVAEMFRLMRGEGQSVQEQQLSVLEQIAENTTGMEQMPAYGF